MSDDTIREMRSPSPGRQPRRSFMKNTEVQHVRKTVLRVTQKKLADNLIDPSTGASISKGLVCKWESGERSVPLWAARHISALAQAAREHDMKEGI